MSLSCGNPEGILDECNNFVANYGDGTWEWGQDRTFKKTVNESVEIAGIGIKVLVGVMGSQLSESPNLLKALNAGRCAILSLGNNAWNLLAAAWWGAHQFGYHTEMETYLNMYADMACTCSIEINGMAEQLR